MRMERAQRFAPEVLQAVAEVREAQTPRQQRQRDDEAQYRRYMLRLERMKQRRQELRDA